MWKSVKDITRSLVLAVLPTAIGSSFLYGFSLGVVNVPQRVVGLWIRSVKCRRLRGDGDGSGSDADLWCRNLTEHQAERMFKENSGLNVIWVLVTALFCLGGVLSVVFISLCVKKYGRKKTLLLNTVFGIVGAIMEFVSFWMDSYEILLGGRLFSGFHSGIASSVSPMYYTELAPVKLRGMFGCLHQLFITLGILFSQIIGLPDILGTATRWPYIFGLSMLPCIFQAVTMPLCPESPKAWYIDRGDPDKAMKVLQSLRGREDVSDELEEMQKEQEHMLNKSGVTMMDLLKDPFLRQLTLIAVVVMASQQLAGINAVVFYSTSIFTAAGLVGTAALYATVGMGLAQVSSTMVSMIFVEKAGRRTLLLVGYGGMFVVTGLLLTFMLLKGSANGDADSEKSDDYAWAAHASMVCVYLFVVLFSVGPGPVPGFITTEIFAPGPRAAGTALGVGANRLGNLVIAVMFPLVQAAIEEYVFVVFLVLLALIFLYTVWKVPETKGKEIETIQEELEQKM